MTKKDKKQDQDISLEEMLENELQKKLDEENESLEKKLKETQKKLNLLEKEKQESLDIAKKVQYDYVNLKTDFDRMQRIFTEKEKVQEKEFLMKMVKDFFPIADQLRDSLAHIDESKSDDSFVKWIKMVYENMMKTLASIWVFPTESLGIEPDWLFHEPLSTQKVEDKKQKWKIIQVFQQGYYLEKDWEKFVILPSKVIVGV